MPIETLDVPPQTSSRATRVPVKVKRPSVFPCGRTAQSGPFPKCKNYTPLRQLRSLAQNDPFAALSDNSNLNEILFAAATRSNAQNSRSFSTPTLNRGQWGEGGKVFFQRSRSSMSHPPNRCKRRHRKPSEKADANAPQKIFTRRGKSFEASAKTSADPAKVLDAAFPSIQSFALTCKPLTEIGVREEHRLCFPCPSIIN